MSIDLARRAFIAGFEFANAGDHPNRSIEIAFEAWHRRELASMADPILDAIKGAGLSVAFDIPARDVPPDAGKLDMGDDPSLGPWTGGVTPVEKFDFSKLPRPGDANYQPRMREFIEGMGVKPASPGTGQCPPVGGNDD